MSYLGSKEMFWLVVSGALLTPWVVEALGVAATLSRAKRTYVAKSDGQRFARGFVGLACTLPIIEMLVTFLPERISRYLGPSMMIFFPILGGLSGPIGAILSIIAGRGIERATSLLACLIAIGLMILMLNAGMYAP